MVLSEPMMPGHNMGVLGDTPSICQGIDFALKNEVSDVKMLSKLKFLCKMGLRPLFLMVIVQNTLLFLTEAVERIRLVKIT